MKSKIFLSLIFLGLFVIMLSSNVLADINITSPTNGTNYTSIAFFNVTLTNSTSSNITNPTIAQFFYNITGGWAVIGNITGTNCSYQTITNNHVTCSGNLSITGVPDGIYKLNVTIWNASNGNTTIGNLTMQVSPVTFDNTIPSIYINFTGAGQFPNGVNSTAMNFTFNYSVSDLGINTCWWSNNSGISNNTLVNCGTNATLNWTNPGPGVQNITIYVNNSVGLINQTSITHGVNNQTPQISAPTLPLRGSNYSGSIRLRVFINDSIGVNTVFFNITNSTGGNGNSSYNATRDGITNYWYFDLNTANLADANNYNVSIYANNSVGLINNTYNVSAKILNITFDNTVPSVPTLSGSSVTTSSVAATITVSDALSGMGTACGVSRTGASVSGTTGTQTFSETGLSCGSDYHYIATCYDLAGNKATSIAYTYTTSDCGSGGSSGSGGGGGSSTTTGTTYVPDTTQLVSSSGYTQSLASNERVKVPVGTETHYVSLKSLTSSQASIVISSNPVQVNLVTGEESKIDVNSDGYYDIYVKLNSISSSKANVTIKTINESIPAGEGAVSNEGAGIPPAEEGVTGEKIGGVKSNWIWIAAIIVIIMAIVIISIAKVGKNKRYMLYGY